LLFPHVVWAIYKILFVTHVLYLSNSISNVPLQPPRSSIEAADGLNRAADLIESEFGTRRRDDVPPDLSPEGASTASASWRVAAKV